MSDKMDLSTDLRRVSLWIARDSDELANNILKRDLDRYKDLKVKIGGVSIGKWLEMIIDRVGGREQAAERALTAAVILSF